MTDRICTIAGPGDLRLLHRKFPDRYPFLLQSTTRDGALGRYDILFALPGETLVASDDYRFLDELDVRWQREHRSTADSSLPFHGGWFLYLGYELAGEIEPALRLAKDPLLPRAFAVRCRAALVFDHEAGSCFFVTEGPDAAAREQALDDIDATREQAAPGDPAPVIVDEEDPAVFMSAVESAREYIAAGDVYQANLSRQWTAQGACETGDIYAALCDANPGPFAGMARWGDIEIISSSPERLLSIRDGQAATRPIAGTRPRSDDVQTDDNLSAELFTNAKERAEHVMLIDLERNDLGRICVPGSVVVDEMMVLESLSLIHI
mgnify:CR=1 FL=1